MILRPSAALLVGLALLTLLPVSAAARSGSTTRTVPTAAEDELDVRAAIRASVRPTAAQRRALAALDGVRAPLDLRYGVPRELIRHGATLTGPSSADPEAIARRFLLDHAALYRLGESDLERLVVAKRYRTRHNGVTHLFFRQVDAGRAVYGTSLGFAVDAKGRIVIAGGPLAPGAAAAGVPVLTAEDAVLRAAAAVGVHADGLDALGASADAARRTVFRNTLAEDVVRPSRLTAELVTFPLPGGLPARLGWKTVTELSETGWYESVVDARTGDVLYRSNYYEHAGPQGTVFREQHPGVAGATRQVTAFTGWVTDRLTSGNNVNAYQDLTDSDSVEYQTQTPASGDPGYQHFDYAWTDLWATNAVSASLVPAGTGGYADVDAAITQLFYYTNVMHDWLYDLGFDEPAGNFQVDNFGKGGAGGDPVNAEATDGWEDGVATNCTNANGDPVRCVNNANFGTPADGSSPRMQMFMWESPWRDGSMDGDVIAHEYGHGVSNRLVGGGSLGSGPQTGGMGEGWSDFISVSKWDDNTVGEYVTGNAATGIRPFAFDNSPLVYTDVCDVLNTGACQVHRDGQIWVATLFDMRTALAARYGEAPGELEAIQLVIDGMKMTPSSPSFLNARDGILAADVATNGGANQCLIWGAFAGREMGPGATSSADQMTVTADTTGPAACTPTADIGGPYVTDEGIDAPLNASTSLNPGDPINPPLTYEWDLDADGQYDDATGATPSFTRVGQDGVFTIGLRVTNAYGFTDADSTTVTVSNVAPSVVVGNDGPKPENTAVLVSGAVSDPGWLEALTATIDFGDGSGVQPLAGVLENARPNATLTYAVSHTYGDNGTFTVEVCGIDDDTQTCASTPVVVTNVAPTAEIDETGSVLVNGVPTFIANAGDSLDFHGRSTDPGSDDLLLSWNWDDGPPAPDVATSYLVNPPGADPFPSPSIQPRDVTDTQAHAFSLACIYDVVFAARDDDAGTASDTVKVLIGGNAELTRSAGYWQNAYRSRRNDPFTSQELLCFLEIAGFVSTVFDELRNAATIAAARDVLTAAGGGGDPRVQLDRQLLAALLNFANGAVGYAELVDTDGDGSPDTAFSAVIAAAEATRANAASTKAQLVAAKDVLERINTRDG